MQQILTGEVGVSASQQSIQSAIPQLHEPGHCEEQREHTSEQQRREHRRRAPTQRDLLRSRLLSVNGHDR
jgi:hypothetical protein